MLGTSSFTARTVGANNFGGFTFLGWSRFRWASEYGGGKGTGTFSVVAGRSSSARGAHPLFPTPSPFFNLNSLFH